MAKVVVVGKLSKYDISMYEKYAETLVDNEEPDGGYLYYNSLHFGEYKFTTSTAKRLQPRVFGNWCEGKFHICLVGNHAGKTYDGFAYDGGNHIPVLFTPKPPTKDRNNYLENCVKQALVSVEAKKNTAMGKVDDPYEGLPKYEEDD